MSCVIPVSYLIENLCLTVDADIHVDWKPLLDLIPQGCVAVPFSVSNQNSIKCWRGREFLHRRKID